MMYKDRVKIIVLLSTILFVGGCAGKRDLAKGVSSEDKKLISSYHDEVLYTSYGIRITKNGFYPDCNINLSKTLSPKDNDKCYKNIYMTKVAEFSRVKKFNLKKFMETINEKNLKKERINRIIVQKEYPSFPITKFNSKDIDILSLKSSSLYEKQKAFVRNKPSYISKIINPSEELQKIAILSNVHSIRYIKNPTKNVLNFAKGVCNKERFFYWEGKEGGCVFHDYSSSSSSNSSYSESYSGSSGSSSGGGHYEIRWVKN